MNVLSLFDGMSCGMIALDRLGIKVDNYYGSEIDKYAMQVSAANYPEIIQVGDITKLDLSTLPKIDLVMGGSPCQDLSFANSKGQGLAGKRSSLFFEFHKAISYLQPKYFLLENVRMKKENLDVISQYMGVQPIMINSDRFVCQNRVRFYWTNIAVNVLPKRPKWNKKYYQWRRTHFRENKSGVCPTLTANMGTGGHNVPLYSKNLQDKLSVVELERLQAVPDNYTNHVSNTQRYKMLGNGWTIEVIAHILKNMELNNSLADAMANQRGNPQQQGEQNA